MTTESHLSIATRTWLTPSIKSMWIGGRAVAAHSSTTLAVVDPATEEVIATVPNADAEDVSQAVALTGRPPAGGWSAVAPTERERLLNRLAEGLAEQADQFEQIIVLENGKLVSAARREVEGSLRYIRYMAGWATKITGQTFDLGTEDPSGGRFGYTRREPIGVVAGIIPWNMPLAMAVWKAVPALACGCPVILKPAAEAPLSSLRLAELATAVGFPDGALSVVTGGGSTGALLARHPGVAKVAFTGSTAVGKEVGIAAISRLARVSLELGGKSPAIVLADADLDSVAKQVARGIFYNQGQVCAAGSRLLADRRIFGDLVRLIATEADRMRLGSGFDPTSEIGPLISASQRDRVVAYLRTGVERGARMVAGGDTQRGTGYFVRPTVLTDVSTDDPVLTDEVFGPVLVAMPFDTEADLITRANESRYGLSASIYSNDLGAVHRLIPQLRVGSVFVNSPARTDPNLPMGGVKESGLGREHGSAMVDLYTEIKSVLIGP